MVYISNCKVVKLGFGLEKFVTDLIGRPGRAKVRTKLGAEGFNYLSLLGIWEKTQKRPDNDIETDNHVLK